MNKKNIFFVFIFFLIINISSYINGTENKILFKINNKSFTSIDYEKRKNYLKFVGDNNDLNKELILNDFISANIFYEYYLNSNNSYELNDKVNEIYLNIIKQKNINQKEFEEINSKESIFENLKLDFIRKTILESFLSAKRDEIFTDSDELDLLYNYTIKYLTVDSSDFKERQKEFENIEFNNLNEVQNLLKSKNIEFFFKEQEIKNIKAINIEIKNNILNNKYFFKINNKNTLSFVAIIKKFETYDGLIAKIFSIESMDEINQNLLKCDNIESIDKNKYKISSKEFSYKKLNDQIKNNLLSVGDYVVFSSNNKLTYIILCGIKFDKEVLNDLNINKKINTIVKEIENMFINKYSKKYNLSITNE